MDERIERTISMIYKIYEADANKLARLPETGMGYQVILASKYSKSESKRKYVIYNSELALIDDVEFKSEKLKIVREGFRAVRNRSEILMLDVESIEVLSEDEIRSTKNILNEFSTNEVKSRDKRRNLGGKAAIDGAIEQTDGKEVFVRLSAFEDDRRIDFENKKLKPGSFTTTQLDYKTCVDIKDDPIDRYALPNDELINWAFLVKPLNLDRLQRGIVKPAFEHQGGGTEVYFKDGTSNNTYLEKKGYGQ